MSIWKTDTTVHEACPCCGHASIGERGNYDICRVCWWEDDGQDNVDASEVLGGPNYHLSLSQGRLNYLKYGIYDPKRTDLRCDPPTKYVALRFFVYDDTTNILSEPNANWSVTIIP